MKDSKLTQFFRSLQADELRWFRDFVQSPYFNKHPDPVCLCEHFIQLARKDFPHKGLDREQIFQLVYPDTPFDEKKLAYTASELLKLGERFIAQRSLEKDRVQVQLASAEACVERGLLKSYQAINRKIDAYFQQADRYHAGHFYGKYHQANIAEKNMALNDLRNPHAIHLKESIEALDSFYLHQRLALTAEVLERMQLSTSKLSQPQTAPLRKLAQRLPQENTPAIAVYLALLDMLESHPADPDLFERFYELFLQNAQHFAPADQRAMCYCAINFCIRQAVSGNRPYGNRALEVYENGLTQHFLFKEEQLSPWDFKNICKLGLGLKRYEWVQRFIKEYVDRLPTDQRADAHHFNLADLYYHQQDYDAALTHLNQVEFSDIPYQLGAKTILLKIYFEINAEEAFLSLAASFQLYLKRNKSISTGLRKAYLNFIKLSLQIYKYGHTKKEKIRATIQETAELNARSWLLAQLK